MARLTPSGKFMCPNCERYDLTESDFYKDRSKKYGLSRWCKSCESGRTQKAKHDYYMRSAQVKQIREKRTKRAYYLRNREQILAENKEYKRRNPDKVREGKRVTAWKWKYHLSKEEREAMIEEQNGQCEICGEYQGDKLHVDHDHKTMRVRAMLCFHCNAGLGHFRENIEVLQIAISYLHFYRDEEPL